MGFKNTGFPRFGFNPIGFTTGGGIIQYLIKKCGLLSYSKGSTDGVLIDKVGSGNQVGRVAVPGNTLATGSGNYLELASAANESITYVDGLGNVVNTTWDANGRFFTPVNGVREFETTISGDVFKLDLNSKNGDGIFQLFRDDADVEAKLAQQFLAPAEPVVRNYIVTSFHDEKGYIEADGTQTFDQAGLITIPIGQLIFLNSLGIPQCYVGGVRPSPDYSGRIGINERVVDGVVDNGVDYGKWETSTPANVLINSNSVEIISNATNTFIGMISTGITKTSTVYTVVIDVTKTFNSGTFGLQSSGVGGFVSFDGTLLDQQRRTLTTDSTITNDELKFFINATVPNGESVEFSHIGTYEGDYVTETPPLPTSGAIVVGNSLILEDDYNHMHIADQAEIWIDQTSHLNKVKEIATLLSIENNQSFYNSTEQSFGFYQTALIEPCLSKAKKYQSIP